MIQPSIDLRPATDAAPTQLTITERAELGRYEAVIGRGLETFLDVGRALIAIREGQLYRGAHDTFEDYCRERWEIGKSRMYQLIASALVIENLAESTIVELPTNEAQVRPLTRLAPDQQVEAYTNAVGMAGGNRPTTAQVQAAAHEVKPRADIKPVRGAKPTTTPTLTEPTYTGTSETVAESFQEDTALRGQPEDTETVAQPAPALDLPLRDWDDTGTAAPTADEQAAIAAVEAERAQEDEERAEREAARVQVDPVVTDLLVRSIYDAEFRQTLRSATLAQLEAALKKIAPMKDPNRYMKIGNRRELLLAAKGVNEMVAPVEQPAPTPPDPRLIEAQAGRELLSSAYAWLRAHYGKLTGKYTDLPPWERNTETLIERLDSLIGVLNGKDITP